LFVREKRKEFWGFGVGGGLGPGGVAPHLPPRKNPEEPKHKVGPPAGHKGGCENIPEGFLFFFDPQFMPPLARLGGGQPTTATPGVVGVPGTPPK